MITKVLLRVAMNTHDTRFGNFLDMKPKAQVTSKKR